MPPENDITNVSFCIIDTCFMSWLHDTTLLDEHLSLCFDVAGSIDITQVNWINLSRRGRNIMIDVILRSCSIAVS